MIHRIHVWLLSIRRQLKDPPWDSVRPVGEWRFVKTSYIWLLTVPALAKLLLPFAGTHEIMFPWWGGVTPKPLVISIGLPFKWTVFVGMALCFFLGRIIYWLACPELIRRYGSFGDYQRDCSGPYVLRRLFERHIRRAGPRSLKALMGAFEKLGCEMKVKSEEAAIEELSRTRKPIPDESLRRWAGKLHHAITNPKRDLSDVFYHIFDALKCDGQGCRLCCAHLFHIGFGLLAWVIVDNLRAFFQLAF